MIWVAPLDFGTTFRNNIAIFSSYYFSMQMFKAFREPYRFSIIFLFQIKIKPSLDILGPFLFELNSFHDLD